MLPGRGRSAASSATSASVACLANRIRMLSGPVKTRARAWLIVWIRSERAVRLATISARIASTAPSRPFGAPRARPDWAARAALIDEAIAVFQELPTPPDQAPPPLDQLLELIGTAFVHTARANLDLLTILIGERHQLAADTRFVEFIDAAATRLGRLIDAAASNQGHGQGYLTARAYFGALIAFVLLQDQLGLASIRPVDAAEYIRHLAQLTARGTGMA
jgi:hypothetical protein